jgi:hypothetical protein
MLRDERAAGATPPPGTHESEHGWLVERLDDVERRKDTALDAAIQRTGAGQRDELTVVVSADVGDAPAMTADADEIADAQGARTVRRYGTYVVSGFNRTFGRTRRWTTRLRNLHHASAIRVQNLPAASARGSKTCELPQRGG